MAGPEKKKTFIAYSLVFFLLFSVTDLQAAVRQHAKLIEGAQTYTAKSIHAPLVPASVQKVVTMYLVWKILGPQYIFSTSLIEVQAGKHYQIAFSFDPSLTDKDLRRLMRYLPKKKPLRIDIISNGLTQPSNPGWPLEDRAYCYAAPVGPAILNNNCAIIKKQSLVQQRNASNRIVSLPKTQILQKPMDVYKELPARIQAYGAEEHIKITQVRWTLKRLPGPILVRHVSKPVSVLMVPGIRKSHNLTMDALWLACAKKLSPKKSFNWKEASVLLSDYMMRSQPNIAKNLRMYDGSGLSGNNRITVHALNLLLQKIEAQPAMYAWARKAFPTAAHDGTLRKRFGRFKHAFSRYQIIAKTGTFKKVRNLCGWIRTRSGQTFRFVWLENTPHHLHPSHVTEDAIIAEIERIIPSKKVQKK